jgi:phenylalanyl-tRNA synthetase beta chain
MKFSEAWLREWIDPPISTRALADRLTMAGLEVDSLGPAAADFHGVVVARVLEVSPHPDSDHLKLCQVDDGSERPLQVVCGAGNVRPSMLAPLARVGGALADGRRIATTLIRGLESHGMLCSARELGLSEHSSGLMSLPDGAPVGQSLRDYLRLDDTIFDVDLTPNRADCLCIAGVAREVATLTSTELLAPAIVPSDATVGDRLPIAIDSPEDCPRYVGRVIRSVRADVTTPLWLQERLRRSGIRCISAIVDVTNYVMLELGQPMHAFDLRRLRGGIRVRRAGQGEELTLLDGQRIRLTADSLVIADHARALALGGIIGGQDSAVGAESRDVFLESAFFAPRAIAGRARSYGLATESSHRFERGVDPDLQVRAIERATALLLDIVGGEAGPVVDIIHAEHLPRRPEILLRPTRVMALLGTRLESERMLQILCALGCGVEQRGSNTIVTPPSYRFDLAIEADLVEEIGRVQGYDDIPATAASYTPVMQSPSRGKPVQARLRSLLVDRGYQEAITFSFIDAALNRLFAPHTRPRPVANPISLEMEVMRSSLWPGLVKAAQYNLNRQQSRVRFFETGLRFSEGDRGETLQTATLAAIALGDALPEQWGTRRREVDFYDVKGDLEALLSVAISPDQVQFEPAEHPALHPGQAARIMCSGTGIGWMGALHPAIRHALALVPRIFAFEVKLDVLGGRQVPSVQEVSKFPAIRRDLAIVVDEAVTAAQVKGCVLAAGGDRLQACEVFDVYRGQGVASGRKSLALGLILQDLTRTLHDEEVDAIVSHTVAELSQRLGASLRV